MDDWKIGSIRVTRILEMCDPLRTPSEWFPDCTDEALGTHLHWLTPRSMGVFGGMFGQRPYRHDIAFPFAIPGNHRPTPFIILVRRLPTAVVIETTVAAKRP